MSFTFTGLPFLSSFSTSTNTHSFLYFCFISFMCIFPTIAIDIFVDLKTFCKCGVVIFGLFLILPRVFTFPKDFFFLQKKKGLFNPALIKPWLLVKRAGDFVYVFFCAFNNVCHD